MSDDKNKSTENKSSQSFNGQVKQKGIEAKPMEPSHLFIGEIDGKPREPSYYTTPKKQNPKQE